MVATKAKAIATTLNDGDDNNDALKTESQKDVDVQWCI